MKNDNNLRRGRARRVPVLIGLAGKRTSQAKPLQKKNPPIGDPSRKHILSHLTSSGQGCMVDVGKKPVSERAARAQAIVRLGPKIALALKKTGALAKGNVIETTRIAGILAAKRTASLIPMCHPLPLDFVAVDISWHGNSLRIEASARCAGRTGVEMEALVAASVAALTVYDMCKSADKGIVIQDIRLLEKSGGKSGHWRRRGEKGQGSSVKEGSRNDS